MLSDRGSLARVREVKRVDPLAFDLDEHTGSFQREARASRRWRGDVTVEKG